MRNFFFNWPSKSLSKTSQNVIQIIAGDFRYLTKKEIQSIIETINNTDKDVKPLIYVFDRDEISVPANERAQWLRAELPSIHVNVLYGAPPLTSNDSIQKLKSFVVSKTPPFFNIKGLKLIAQEAIQDLHQSSDLLSVSSRKRLINNFSSAINANEQEELIENQIHVVKADIKALNLNHPNSESFFSRTPWDLSQLNRVNKPVVIGNINNPCDQKRFLKQSNAQVFDMPIYMPGQGWKIPREFDFLRLPLAKITAAETLANPEIEACNAYMTYDNSLVYPNTYARREGLHVDGFLTKANCEPGKVTYGDHTYLISSQQSLQTLCYLGPFDLSKVDKDNAKEVLSAFDKQGSKFMQFNAYDIIRLTANNVHAVACNDTGQILPRAFLKVTFSDRLFNRSGNTVNTLFNYRFTYVARSAGDRNTQNFIGEAPEGYKQVSLKELDFTNKVLPDWVDSKIENVIKNPKGIVTAIKATPGEVLHTKIGADVITVNTAQEGDMKVIRDKDDCYFLGKNFHSLYRATEIRDKFVPFYRELKAVKTVKNVTFTAPWGTRENIRAGGYIVQDKNKEVWGVHEDSFKATYKPI